jgi:hypothetical protein
MANDKQAAREQRPAVEGALVTAAMDQEWAGRMVRELLADRAEEERGEAAAAARADHQHLCVAGSLD